MDEQNYANCEKADTAMADANLGGNVTVTAPTADGDLYKVDAASASSDGTKFTITKLANGTYSRTCDKPGKGSCNSQSKW